MVLLEGSWVLGQHQPEDWEEEKPQIRGFRASTLEAEKRRRRKEGFLSQCAWLWEKMSKLILRLRSLMNLKCADLRLSCTVLKGLWFRWKDFSAPPKLTGGSLLYRGQTCFDFNDIYPFFVLLKLSPKHVLTNASINRLKIPQDSLLLFFKGNLFNPPGNGVIQVLKGFACLGHPKGLQVECCKHSWLIPVTQ